MEEKGCIMVRVKHPDLEKFLEQIKEEDIYNNDENEYGLETESHVTILYGILHNKHTVETLKALMPPIEEIKLIGTSLTSFNNEDFDVLKIDIKSNKLTELNQIVTNNLEYETKYKDYNPHLTIAYLKKGTSKKYEKELLDKILVLEPIEYDYSFQGEHDYWG